MGENVVMIIQGRKIVIKNDEIQKVEFHLKAGFGAEDIAEIESMTQERVKEVMRAISLGEHEAGFLDSESSGSSVVDIFFEEFDNKTEETPNNNYLGHVEIRTWVSAGNERYCSAYLYNSLGRRILVKPRHMSIYDAQDRIIRAWDDVSDWGEIKARYSISEIPVLLKRDL